MKRAPYPFNESYYYEHVNGKFLLHIFDEFKEESISTFESYSDLSLIYY